MTCILFSMSGVFANDALNETIGESDLNSNEIQADSLDDGQLTQTNDALSVSVVYFNASASSDGDGSKTNPYKYYKSGRIDYGSTAYFADGIYYINETDSIYSSSTYKTTFIGQSMEKTIFASKLSNKFDFTVTDNSYFVLKNLTMVGVHINNQANLIADNVVFAKGVGFNPYNQPALSYSYNSKLYDSTYGGVIICDTPSGKITTLDFSDCQFISNSASSGGVIATCNSVANIKNCVFYNSSADRFGGAIYSLKSNLTIQDSYFEQNDAKYGGVIFANSSNLNLKDSNFNLSQAYCFGGVIASFLSQLDVNHVLFNDYASLEDAGGAIYGIRGTLNVVDSSFMDGRSDFGGAICNLMSNSTISDSKFINNTATYYGGSIYNMYGNVVLTRDNFANSHADSGGSIFNRLSDSFSLFNNNFKDSTADEGQIIFIDGGKINVVERGNVYDSSQLFLKYGNVYDMDYYSSVPLINYSAEAIDVLPSSYDSRKYGYITPAKDQIQGGNCWAFAGISTLEACLKKATGIDYDFSEENVKNLMSEYSLFDSEGGINTGGNLYMFIAYLAGWFGPTYDEYDPYDDFSSLSVIYDSIVHVQNVYILPDRESFFDNDYIKRAVMQYGAVSIGIDLSENEGHAVTIVGWDDEFTSNDFLGNKAVGAWIIKNSWGSEWGYNGFGYLSYQQYISFGYTFIFDDDRGYSNIYQYDFAGKSGFHSINSSEAYIKNKFTAKNDEILSAFSTYFDKPTDFTVSVYLNGNLVTTQNGYSETGYYTIPFVNEVPLKKGDSFEISVKFSNGYPVYIPICTADEINKITFDKGISFYSTDGRNWDDLYESNTPGVACIKAFTRLKTLTEISIDVNQFGGDEANPLGNVSVDDLVNIQLNLPEYYVADGFRYPLDGLVTFTINDQYYYATVENGKACLNVTFDKEGTYNVTAQFESSRVVSNLVNFNVTVLKTAQSNLVIKADDVSKFYGGPEKYVATLSNDGKALSGVNVRVSVDGKNDTLKTDSNGQIILDLSLPVGEYDVHLQYGGKKVSSKVTVLSTISVNNVTQDFWDSYVSASFLNTDGSLLSNKEIVFNVTYYSVNSLPYPVPATINAFGLATAKINLAVNKYWVSVVNPVSGEEKRFTLEILPIDSTCLLSVTQLGSVVTISANVNPVSLSSYVNFIFLGNVYKANIVNGTARLVLQDLDVGDYNVTAIYSTDENLKVSSDTKAFSVTKNAYKLSSGNYWGYYGASGTMATIIDSNSKGIEGELVKATVLNKTYFNTTDENGNAMFNLDLEVGNYTVLFEYKGQSLLQHIYVYSTINMVDFSGEYLNSKVGAKFIYPYYGDIPESMDVKFIIYDNEYNATTDKDGYASVNVDLPVGVHTVTTINLCTGEKKQSKITIYKTTPAITITKSKRGDTLLLTADLGHDSAVGNVVFTMGSNKYTAGVKNGKAILALNVLDEGSYEAYANYIGDYNFNNILSPTIKFEYAHTDYALSAPELSKYYGGPEKFTITLTDGGNPVTGEVVTLDIEDKTYNLTTDTNGIATFDVKLDPGFHVLECSFDDKTFKSAINVESTITLNGGTGDVSVSKTSVQIRDGNGELAKNKVVTFKIGAQEFKQATDNMGVATLDANLGIGNYTVTVTNPITGEVKYSTLIITKVTPDLSLSFVEENGKEVLKAVLPKTATGDMDFVLNNDDEYTLEIIDGVSVLEGLDPGEYDVVVNYKGDDNFNPVSKSIKITVSEAPVEPVESVLISSDVKTTYGTGKNIVVQLKDINGNPLVGRTVTVKLNGKNYQGNIGSDGRASIAIPATLAVKTYTATISYAGETGILAKASSIKVTVNKATPKLTASKKTFKVKDKTKSYVVTLKTDKNKAYSNKKVTITVGGKTYSATTKKGKATFKLTKLTKKGTFKATVKFAGNSYYKAVTKKNVVIIVK